MRRGGALAGLLGVVLVLALVAAHLLAFGLVSARLALPAAAAGAVVALALAVHLGALGALGAQFRRWFHGEGG